MELTALDLVIFPSASIETDLALPINEQIVNNCPTEGFKFDDTHLPHITVLQLYVKSDQIDQIEASLTKLCEDKKPLNLKITRIDPGPLFGDTLHLPSLVVDCNSEIQNFHESVISTLQSFTIKSNGIPSYFVTTLPDDKINEASMAWVKNFLTNSSFAKYFPHVTLGAATKQVIDLIIDEYQNKRKSFPVQFMGNRIALCQLGNFCTCRKVIKEWTLN